MTKQAFIATFVLQYSHSLSPQGALKEALVIADTIFGASV